MTTIDDVLDRIRESSTNTKEVGDRFERLMAAFFRSDRTYKAMFSNVWMWSDWPGNEGKVDTGIDLVVENADGSGYTAIQCKCYAPTNTINKSDIDSFFTASGKAPFTNRIIVSTSSNWSKHAEDALRGQDKPVQRIGVNDLDESTIDWGQWDLDNLEALKVRPRKTQRPHQTQAIDETLSGFKTSDRGKLIMACGTGKTFTAQRIAEELVGAGGNVLVLTPSISLLSQTLKEWTADATIPLAPLAICSDSKAGKRGATEDISPYDLVLPATTDPDLIVAQYKRTSGKENMTVFFSTYQSLPVIAAAQANGVPDFDLIIADEAHRTTGVTIAGEDDSNFTRVHDNNYVKGAKRLYMTATPRVFSDSAKGKASGADAVLASMDDSTLYGPEFYRLGFHEAVQRDLLTDYKVLILAVDEAAVSRAFQRQLSDENNEIKLDDATRIVGCVNALAKRDALGTSFASDPEPMQRAVAFSNTIAQSKKFTNLFAEIASQWNNKAKLDSQFHVEVDHVDGKFNSLQRESLLHWLKTEPADDSCKILSNAKCLTEGVDVPALDAILFLEPRNSMVDVIQAVGRVMRKAGEGKKFGYVVLPVGIPSDQTPEQALSDNKRFQAVWQVLNALRSHDERMNAVINKLDLNEEPPGIIEIIGVGGDEDDDATDPADTANPEKPRQLELGFPIDELREGIYAKLVLKVGTRHYWEDWAKDVADIAARHHTRITALIEDPNVGVSEAFDHFVAGLHATINDSITRDDAITMLSQHLITKPIFEALFTEFAFTESNPVSKAMQGMIDLLDEHSLDKETESLEGFYDSVRMRVEGIDNAAGKQKIITELYEGFFSKAFPKAAESLGIVYTPVELVDFVLHAADHALRKHFNGMSMTDEGVNILDPFCGTGTFIVRLLQSGIIKPEDLARKYKHELHSNEYLLLAYYIAAINIESTFHDAAAGELGKAHYEPFDGIVLTDTFQLGEAGDGTGSMDVFPVNNERAALQKSLGIRVIVGNPPYSIGQTSQNDNNENLVYPQLDRRITETYAKKSSAVLLRSLYDSYVRAFRWSSDRVLQSERGGIIAFVTNGGFIDSNTFDGFRKSIASEYHHIYCYNLRGNTRTSGELARKEGGQTFGSGSRATVAITLLIKEPGPVPQSGALIHYRDIGDYLSREQKLQIIGNSATTNALENVEWTELEPNDQADWINQRSSDYLKHIPLNLPSGSEHRGFSVFDQRNLGNASNRDAWNYNSSRGRVVHSANQMVRHFNEQVEAFEPVRRDDNSSAGTAAMRAKKWIIHDSRNFSWTANDYTRLANGEKYDFQPSDVVEALYRPFFRQYLNANRKLNARPGRLLDQLNIANSRSLAFCVSGASPFGVLMVDSLPDLNLLSGGAYTFLMNSIEVDDADPDDSAPSLFNSSSVDHVRRSHVTEEAIRAIGNAIGTSVTGEEVFFYAYGVLHSSEYRAKYAPALTKEMPRIPLPPSTACFNDFVNGARELALIHTQYESIDPWPDLDIKYSANFNPDIPESYRVEKMKYAKSGRETDRTTIIFNSNITISNIPLEAHDYTIGSKSALDWIVDKYQVKPDKDSGIVNDPNDWATEHGDPTYIFDLVRRIVTVSMRTNEIVAGLPSLNL
jgi:predicted helicase